MEAIVVLSPWDASAATHRTSRKQRRPGQPVSALGAHHVVRDAHRVPGSRQAPRGDPGEAHEDRHGSPDAVENVVVGRAGDRQEHDDSEDGDGTHAGAVYADFVNQLYGTEAQGTTEAEGNTRKSARDRREEVTYDPIFDGKTYPMTDAKKPAK